LTSARTFAYASIMGGAPALLMRASRLSQPLSRPLSRSGFSSCQSSFSAFTRKEAPKAARIPQRLLVRRMREQHRIEQLCAQSEYQRRLSELAAITHRARQSSRWSELCEVFDRIVMPLFRSILITSLYAFLLKDFATRFV
jgi:hypothetical protein